MKILIVSLVFFVSLALMLPGAFAATTTTTDSNNGTLYVQVKDASTGAPIYLARITAIRTSSYLVKYCSTDRNGICSISLPPAYYSVSATATGYVSKAVGATITANKTTAVTIALSKQIVPKTGFIDVTVRDYRTWFLLQGTKIAALRIGGTAYGVFCVTDANGHCLMRAQIGDYNVTASKAGYFPDSNRIRVLENSTVRVNFFLKSQSSPGYLWARVTDSNNNPIEQARIFTDTNYAICYTNRYGNCSTQMKTGDYNMTASKIGYLSDSKSVRIIGDTTTNANFVLRPINN